MSAPSVEAPECQTNNAADRGVAAHVEGAPHSAKTVFRTGNSGGRRLDATHVTELWSVLPNREGVKIDERANPVRHPVGDVAYDDTGVGMSDQDDVA